MARLENGIVYKFSNLTGLSALLMPKMVALRSQLSPRVRLIGKVTAILIMKPISIMRIAGKVTRNQN
jgi:hypothetical protein